MRCVGLLVKWQLVCALLYVVGVLLTRQCAGREIVFAFMAMTAATPANDYFLYSNMGASVPIALEDLRLLHPEILPNDTLTYVTQPAECDTKVGCTG